MTDMQASVPSLHTLLLVSAAGLPLLAAAALLIHGLRRIAASILVLLSPLPALCLALLTSAGAGLAADGVSLPWMLTGVRLGMDGTSRIFLLFTSILWAVAAPYACTYLENDPARRRFFFFFLISMSGNIGLILAQDMVGFYLFFALMTFAGYGLVIHTASPAAFHAAKVYIVMAVMGEALVIAGMFLAASAAGGSTVLRDIPSAVAASESRNLIIALILFGFGVKAGTVPLHIWMPLAYPAAPTPAGAVLSGPMIKAGILGWLRFLPLGMVSLPDWGAILMIAGLFAVFYGVAIGLTRVDPKAVLAYSSVSQMGLMTLALGVGMTASGAWPMASSVILLYAFHHALSKGALFLGTGVAATGAGGVLGRRLVAAGLFFPALALAGAPLTSGAAAKTALKSTCRLVSLSWLGSLEWMLSLAAVATTLLMGRFLFLVLMCATPKTDDGLKPGLWLPWAVLLVCGATAVWVLPSQEFFHAAQTSLAPGNLMGALWPVLIGAILVASAWFIHSRVPPAIDMRTLSGVVHTPLARGLAFAETAGRRITVMLSQRRTKGAARLKLIIPGSFMPKNESVIEAVIGRWFVAGILFIMVATALFVAFQW